MIAEISSFLIVWYTGLPFSQHMDARHFFEEQDACEFIVNKFDQSRPGSINKPVMYEIKTSETENSGMDLVRVECVEITPTKRLWNVKKI